MDLPNTSKTLRFTWFRNTFATEHRLSTLIPRGDLLEELAALEALHDQHDPTLCAEDVEEAHAVLVLHVPQDLHLQTKAGKDTTWRTMAENGQKWP